MEKQQFKIVKANTSEMFEQALNNVKDNEYVLRGNVFVLPNKQAGPHGFEIMQLLELKETVIKGYGKK